MAFSVMNNSSAMMVLAENNKNTNKLAKSLKKVSSGMKLNSAGDAASEYSISEKMRVQLRSLNQDIDNCKKGITLVDIAERGISNIVDSLRNLKEMALDSANGHNSEADRAIIQKEFSSMIANINDIASDTNYNGKILLDGRYWYKETYYEESASLKSSKSATTSSGVVSNPGVTSSSSSSKAGRAKGITEGTVTALQYDSTVGLVDNSVQGMVPAATGINLEYIKDYKTNAIEVYSPEAFQYFYGNGATGSKNYWYVPDETKTVYNSTTGYTSLTPYNRPKVGDVVSCLNYSTKYPPIRASQVNNTAHLGVISIEPGTGKYIVNCEEVTYNKYVANGNTYDSSFTCKWSDVTLSRPNVWSSYLLDFSNVTDNGKSVSFPDGFHGQGFTIFSGITNEKPESSALYDAVTSIVFDATMDSGKGKLITDETKNIINPYSGRPIPVSYYQYVIGIKDAKTSDDIEKCVFDGIADAVSRTNHFASIETSDRPTDVNTNALSTVAVTKSSEGLYITDYGNGNYVLSAHIPTPGGGNIGTRMGLYNGVMDISGTIAELPKSEGGGSGGTNPSDGSGTGGDKGEQGGTSVTPDDNDEPRIHRLFEGNPLIIHHGPKSSQHLRIYINDMHSEAMGLKDVAVDPLEKALEALDKIDEAIEYALNENIRMGEYHIKLDEILDNLTRGHENTAAAESVIRDADMAKEMAEYVKNNVLSQASQSMLAQANQSGSNVLSLLN